MGQNDCQNAQGDGQFGEESPCSSTAHRQLTADFAGLTVDGEEIIAAVPVYIQQPHRQQRIMYLSPFDGNGIVVIG